ncbi:MAG: hypothetical protein H0V60_03535 [Actinobacteria bacterium]|nr:hypothetical protein [Actinomycetota bacterium]
MQGWWGASYAVLWALVVVLCIVVVALARQIGTLHLRLGPRGALEIDDEGPVLGEAPEPVATTDLGGREVVLGGPGEAQLLLFVSPGCRLCDQVLPSTSALAGRGRLAPYVVTDVDTEEAGSAFGVRRLHAPVIASRRTAEAYSVPGTPYVVVLDELGVVTAKGIVNNLEQMEGLVDTAVARARQNAGQRTTSL